MFVIIDFTVTLIIVILGIYSIMKIVYDNNNNNLVKYSYMEQAESMRKWTIEIKSKMETGIAKDLIEECEAIIRDIDNLDFNKWGYKSKFQKIKSRRANVMSKYLLRLLTNNKEKEIKFKEGA